MLNLIISKFRKNSTFRSTAVIVMVERLQHQTLCCKLSVCSNNLSSKSPAATAAAWLDNQVIIGMLDGHL